MSLAPSSPRLPSPPPPTEIQIGPQSPALGSSSNQESAMEQSVINANSSRRIHPGTKSVDMAAGPPLIPLLEVSLYDGLRVTIEAATRSPGERFSSVNDRPQPAAHWRFM